MFFSPTEGILARVLFRFRQSTLIERQHRRASSPLVGAWFSRYSEKRADRVAADLGFGPQLIEALQTWMHLGMDSARKQAGVRANLLASHPSLASRIRALETYLYRE